MTDTSSNASEELALDRALQEAAPLLAESLQRDEQHRRRKRRLIAGGLVMLACILSLVGILFLGGVPSGKPGTPLSRIEAVAEADALNQKGWGLWMNGQFDEASKAFADAIKLDPQSADLWNGLGWSLFRSGDSDKATDAFIEALKLDEAHPAALNGMGQIAFSRRNYLSAKDWFLKAKHAPAAQISLVSTYLLLGEYEQAESLADELLEGTPVHPEDGSTISGRAYLLELKAAAEAGAVPDELRARIEPAEPKQGDAADAQALSQRGWTLWGERKWRAAELAFLEALELEPDLSSAHNGLGWAHISQGQPERAQKYLERCLELEPNHGGAINGLALCLKNQGKIDQAIKLWEDLYRESPQPHAGASNLARTYVEQGRFEDAVPLLEQLIQANPGNQEYQELLDQARNSGASMDTHETVQPMTGIQKLLNNGGLERGTEGWIIGSNSGRMELTPDKETKTEGEQSLRIAKTGGMPIDIVRIDCDGLTPGQKVTVSAKIKAQGVGNAWMKFYVWDAEGNVLIEDLDVARIHGTCDWRIAKKRFTIPEGTTKAAIQFWMILDGTVWIDDVRIEAVE